MDTTQNQKKKFFSGLKTKPNSYNVVNCVPYQKCPICDGSGLDTRFVCAGSPFGQICTVCDGKRIIPMHVIKEELKVVENNKSSITCYNRCGNTLPSNNEHNNICLNCGSSIIRLL